ncbi:hypothetical protein HHJ52_24420 (plasmid) [Escherichia coli]|nr:hypothetical protein HHJ52_24420 [Escherichia coli]
MKKERGFSLVEIALFSVLIGVVMANIYDIKKELLLRIFIINNYHLQFAHMPIFSRYINMENNINNITDDITIDQLKRKG